MYTLARCTVWDYEKLKLSMNFKALQNFGDNSVLKLSKPLYGLKQACMTHLTTLLNVLASCQTLMMTTLYQTFSGKCFRYYHNLRR